MDYRIPILLLLSYLYRALFLQEQGAISRRHTYMHSYTYVFAPVRRLDDQMRAFFRTSLSPFQQNLVPSLPSTLAHLGLTHRPECRKNLPRGPLSPSLETVQVQTGKKISSNVFVLHI